MAKQHARDGIGATDATREIEFLDNVLQGLFGVGLRLEYCISLLDEAPGQARVGLESVVSRLDELTEPLRVEIGRLAGPPVESQGDE
jgi:hypothetical protein